MKFLETFWILVGGHANRCPNYHLCDYSGKSRVLVEVNNTEVCKDVWDNLTSFERWQLEMCTDSHSRGLIDGLVLSARLGEICDYGCSTNSEVKARRLLMDLMWYEKMHGGVRKS